MKGASKCFGIGAGVLLLLAGMGISKNVARKVGAGALIGAHATGGGPRAVESYGKLPLSFEVNQGQTDAHVRFLARGQGYGLFLTSQEAVLSLRRSEGRELRDEERTTKTSNAVLKMRMVGANAKASVSGEEELPGKSNYFIGNDAKKWRTNIPTFAKVRIENVYPGVDLVYYGNQGQLEYDFVVKPGADPKAIRLALAANASGGKSDVKVGEDGDLAVQVDGGEVRFHKPVVYQRASLGDNRIPVDGRYTINDQNDVAFAIAEYDKNKPLVIDPVLVYSTYLGGSGSDQANGIAVDSSGSAYVTGCAGSLDFPTSAGAFQGTKHGGIACNAFVTKFNAAGSALIYSTYLGGSGGDQANGIAVDSSGSAYVTGYTYSTDFPTSNPIQPTNRACSVCITPGTSGFVTKLDATGSALVYSTYLGGGYSDSAAGIAVDSSGNAYVTGSAGSPDFPTVNAIQAINKCHSDPSSNGFVTEINAAGSALVYSTFLGGSGSSQGCDTSNAITVDSSGDAYVTGFTRSPDFPTTPNSLQPTCTIGAGGCYAGFVTEITAGGSTLAYSTFLQQPGAGWGAGIAVDGSGNAYVTGLAAFVAKLNPAGSALIYIRNLRGSGFGFGSGIAVNSSGNAYVTGYTTSTDFLTANPIQASNHSSGSNPSTGTNSYNAVVAELTPDGSGLVYSTYLGGTGGDQAQGIALDGSGNAYIAGFTRSSDFPTANPYQATNNTYNGSFYANTGFVSKIALAGDLDITNSTASVVVSGSTLTYTIALTNNGPDATSNVNIQDAIPAGATFNSVAVSAGTCTAPAAGGTGTVTCTMPSMASGTSITETLVVNVTAGLGTMSDTATVSSSTFDPTPGDHSSTVSTTVVGLPSVGAVGGQVPGWGHWGTRRR